MLVMAAWIVVGVVGGLVIGSWGTWLVIGQGLERLRGDLEQQRMDAASWRRLAESMPTQPDPTLTRLIERLADSALPKREELSAEQPPDTPGEYEAPFEPVADWTDPFFGLERSLVGGLAPGQAIPGIGQPDDDYGAGDDDAYADVPAEWQEMGDDAFAAWQAQQDDARG